MRDHVVHLIRVRRATLKRKAKKRSFRPRRIPRQIAPLAIERAYLRWLWELIDQVKAEYDRVLPQVYQLLEMRTDDARRDAEEGKRARAILNQTAASIRERLKPDALDDLAERFAVRTSEHNREQVTRQMKAALGVDPFIADRKLKVTIDGFVVENVTLIQDIPERIISDLEKAVTRAFASGTLKKDLEEELTEKFGFAKERAKVIARDQIGKLNGQLSRTRNQELGMKRYRWRTMNDERVRDEHAEREGQIFSYDDPPEGGHPGDDYQCRCYDEPVFEDLLADIAED